jgi:hypothetical protein
MVPKMNGSTLTFFLVLIAAAFSGVAAPPAQKTDALVEKDVMAVGEQYPTTGVVFSVQLSDWFYAANGSSGHSGVVPFDIVRVSNPPGLFNLKTHKFRPGKGNGGVWKLSATSWSLYSPAASNPFIYIFQENKGKYIGFGRARTSGTFLVADCIEYIADNDDVEVILAGDWFHGSDYLPMTTFNGFLISRTASPPKA